MATSTAFINLELVGVYFNQGRVVTFEVDNDGFATVEAVQNGFLDLLEEGTLKFVTDTTDGSMKTISHKVKEEFKSQRSGYKRDPGLYTLTEQKLTERDGSIVARAWQYYIIDTNRVRVSATNAGEGFKEYTNAKFRFENGWTIRWRMVDIVVKPAPLPADKA